MLKNRVFKKMICFTTPHKDPFLISKCPIEYSVLVQPNYEFSKWLADNMSFKPGSAKYGYWITGFKGQKSLQENSDDLVSMTTSTEAMDMAMAPTTATPADFRNLVGTDGKDYHRTTLTSGKRLLLIPISYRDTNHNIAI